MALLLLLQLSVAAPRPASPDAAPDSITARAALTVLATRRTAPLEVDAILDEPEWHTARPAAGFTQREPAEGEPASQESDVRVLVDNDAIYIGAHLKDTSPDSIQALLARRDRWNNSDRFFVFLDCYRDGRSGFYFGINAAGTLYDGTLYNDDWDSDTWDGVWEGVSRRTDDGWVAEIRIPFSQLRFKPGEKQAWGINFKREIARRSEYAYLVHTPQNASGFVSRFPLLEGLDGIQPPRRIEIMPYVTAKAEYLRHGTGDPFNDGSRYRPGAGADFKFGVGANLTLTGTVNPDFGQVEVDPAVVNLSDVEVFFEERRPFFIEGADIFDFGWGGSNNYWGFNWASHDFLYTRRIGRTPSGSVPEADFSDLPQGTHILGAGKLSGKVGSWNIGGLSALTKRESAELATGTSRTAAEIEPLANYTALRAQKEMNGGRQGLGFIATATGRFFDDPRLRAEMNSSGLALGMDGWTFLDREKVWVIAGWAGMSRVSGTRERMLQLQQNSAHYFQRPDASHVEVDSTATSLFGYAGRLILNKQKGDWRVNAGFGLLDPGFEINDLGFAPRTDLLNSHFVLTRRFTRPNSWYRRLTLNTAVFGAWDFGGTRTGSGLWHSGSFQWKSFAWSRWRLAYYPDRMNVRNTRGGPRMQAPSGFEGATGWTSDERKNLTVNADVGFSRFRLDNDKSWWVETSVEWKPTSKLAISVGPGYSRNGDGAQYIGTFTDPLATSTYGARYVFGDLVQDTWSGNIRLNWIFSPRLSLELFAQPLLSTGEYTTVKELARPGTYDFNRYGENGSTYDRDTGIADPDGAGPAAPIEVGNPDFTFASLRGNAVMRWEYAPGSTLFLVWTHNRAYDVTGETTSIGEAVRELRHAPSDNVLMVKVSYWWNP